MLQNISDRISFELNFFLECLGLIYQRVRKNPQYTQENWYVLRVYSELYAMATDKSHIV